MRKEELALTDDALKTLKELSTHFFTILTLVVAREKYQDELSSEMRRIDSELEELRQQLTDKTKEIGELILKQL